MVERLNSFKMLRQFYKYLVAGSCIVLIAISSCKKIDDFGSTNTNPGATTSPVTSALLTNVLSTLSYYTWDAGNGAGINTVSGLYCQYFSETQYTDVSVFNKEKADWNFYYAANLPSNVNAYTNNGPLFDLKNIIDQNTADATKATAALNGSNANQIAIARILKVYIYSTLTDIFGDLPYSKALAGDNGVTPYDKQQAIYTDMFKELTAAVAQFDGGATVKGDILFNGSVASWKKFANSIHLLLGLRLSRIDAGTAQKEVQAALASGVIGAGESIQLSYPGGSFLNPVYNYYDVTKRFDYAVSKTMTDWLTSHGDARILTYGTSSIGFPFGLSRDNAVAFANANTKYAQLLKGQGQSSTDPFNIMTSAEIFLARSEAAQRGWTGEDPVAMYQTGIQESWKLWKLSSDQTDSLSILKFSDSALNAYMNSPNISLSSGDVLGKICTQEWVTHYPAGPRGWSDWRRTGYPTLVPGPGAVNAAIPRRIAYGPNEYSYNPTNVAAAAAQYVGSNGEKDSNFGRIWWDAQ
jgi:hypothetical protein